MKDQYGHLVYTREEWTQGIFSNMIEFLSDKKIETVVDLGANVGEVSQIFLEKIPTIKKIYAFEPESQNFLFLQNRFTDESRIKPIKKGIFYGEKNSVLFSNGGSGSYTVVKRGVEEVNNFVLPLSNDSIREVIELTDIESEISDVIDLVKIDIEGAEYNVLKNSTLIKSSNYLIIEFHPFGMEDWVNFNSGLPCPGITGVPIQERVEYIKKFTDDFVCKHLSNYRIVLASEEQYLLEKI